MKAAVLEARDLFYIYRAAHGDVAALRGLTVDVPSGEVVSVVGPSGAGKTTLLRLAAGWLRPSSGELTVLGKDVVQAKGLEVVRRSEIGLVRQHYHRALPQEFTIEEIVAMPLRLLGVPDRTALRRARALLGRTGLGSRADALPSELSGGEQQRAAICSAVVKRPRLILADEPTGELDRQTSATVIDLLLELAADLEAGALIVTHDDEVALRTPRTIHIRDGRLAAEGMSDPVLIVDEQGWVRLPERLRAESGLAERVRASAAWGRIELVSDELQERTGGLARADGIGDPLPPQRRRHVHVDSVSKSFDRRPVLSGFSRSFAAGALHVVAGPSGTGKTTLLNLIAGLDRPDGGEVRVGDDRVDVLDADGSARWRQETLGYVSQHSTLAGFLTAVENVELGLLLRGRHADARRQAETWIDWVDLTRRATQRADQLSGGEQRRVAVARALAPLPAVLVADEPTAHLDRVSGRLVIRLLLAAASLGITVIAASHDSDLVSAADHVIALEASS